jgi:hypothetical protein
MPKNWPKRFGRKSELRPADKLLGEAADLSDREIFTTRGMKDLHDSLWIGLNADKKT